MGLAFLYGLPGHFDDGQAWLEWLSMLGAEWEWSNFVLISIGVILFLYAALPQRVLVWAGSTFLPNQRPVKQPESHPKEKYTHLGQWRNS